MFVSTRGAVVLQSCQRLHRPLALLETNFSELFFRNHKCFWLSFYLTKDMPKVATKIGQLSSCLFLIAFLGMSSSSEIEMLIVMRILYWSLESHCSCNITSPFETTKDSFSRLETMLLPYLNLYLIRFSFLSFEFRLLVLVVLSLSLVSTYKLVVKVNV